MLKRILLPTTLVTLVLASTGCGLFETNDDELETLRVEIIQLREDLMEVQAEVSLLAQRAPTTTISPTPTTTAAPATTTSMAVTGGSASVETEDDVPTVTVPVGLNEDAILLATYQWGPSDPAVILQELLGVTADGWYGNGTRTAHLAELEARGLDTSGVPSPPTTTIPADAASDDSADAASDDSADAASDDSPDATTTTTEAPAETTTTTEASE
ncbi:MAG: hypothetical protein CL467_05145 [Acidimicrobiaceae bacterium]|nr:hypothetical protein [Acidimicrobiaceae bacterium]